MVHSTATFLTEPLTLEQRLAWLDSRSPGHPVTVALDGGAVVGWGALGDFRSRPAYRDTAEFSVAHPGEHRRGIDRALLDDRVERARAAGHHALGGGGSSESTAVLAFLENSGFAASPISPRSAASSTAGSTSSSRSAFFEGRRRSAILTRAIPPRRGVP